MALHLCPQANIAELEVSIPARLHNSLIGTKGRLIRSIMEECGGVHIHFPVEGSGSDTVVIRGPSSDVEKAKKQLLHLAEEKVGFGRVPCRPGGSGLPPTSRWLHLPGHPGSLWAVGCCQARPVPRC